MCYPLSQLKQVNPTRPKLWKWKFHHVGGLGHVIQATEARLERMAQASKKIHFLLSKFHTIIRGKPWFSVLLHVK